MLAALLLGALVATPLFADVFRLKDGRRLEGTVVREIGDLLSIKTADGIVTVDKADVLERIAAKTPYDKYKERLAAASADDPAQQLELARWCVAEGLAAESTFHYKRLLELVQDHEEAREKLGYIWFAGGWYLDGSPELAARKAELEATPTQDVTEIPEGAEEPTPEALPDLPSYPVSAQSVAITLDERLDKDPPRRSTVPYEFGLVLGSLSTPMRPSPGLDPARARLEVRVKIRVFYVKTDFFYETPTFHIFRGEAEAEILERAEDGTVKVVGRTQCTRPFSSSVRNPKEKALLYTYFATVERLADHLAQVPYFKELGAKIPDRSKKKGAKDPKAPKSPPPAEPAKP